jgi:adenylylsulfate kinase-like enzyme
MAKLFLEAGLITMVAFISLFRAERQMAREGWTGAANRKAVL